MKYLTLITLFLLLWSCKEQEVSSDTINTEDIKFSLPGWAKNATIYEANTRHMSDAGNFKGLEAQLPRLKNMGIDIIWLMPIHPISVVKRKATGDILVKDIRDENEKSQYLGSPYAVADYKKVNPDFGTMDEFKELVNAAHAKNMKIIIDWVPNHTGWDNPWIIDHPEWFTKDSLGNITDPINDEGEKWGWTDVADLDYENKEMRAAMIESLQFWLTETNLDGYRMDVAHGIDQDFWDECTPALLKTKKDIFLLAEAEVPSHRNNETFHASYAWNLHHILNDIAKGNKTASAIDTWVKEDSSKFSSGFHMHFTSNHDENAWAGTVFDRMGEAHLTLAALAATFDGMPLIYSGMEEPLRKRLEFFKKDNIEFKDYAYAPFYTKLFNLKHNNQALWNGEFGGKLLRLTSNEAVYAFSREKNDDKVYGIFNVTKDNSSFTAEENIVGKDAMTNEEVNIQKGQTINLKPWQYLIVSNK
jgi:glycosidase